MSMYENNIERTILFQLEKTSKASKSYAQREFDKINLGITIDQWGLLQLIHETEELSQKELAEKSMRDPASITRTLVLLENKGLINKKDTKNDKRLHKIFLTKKGKDFIENNNHNIAAVKRNTIAGFTDGELSILNSLLERMEVNLTKISKF